MMINCYTYIIASLYTYWRRITYLLISGGIHAREPTGSSLSEEIGPRGWFKSPPPDDGRPNIKPPLRGPVCVGYNFRPHSNSSVGHGDAELKPGTVSSDRRLIKFNNNFYLQLIYHT